MLILPSPTKEAALVLNGRLGESEDEIPRTALTDGLPLGPEQHAEQPSSVAETEEGVGSDLWTTAVLGSGAPEEHAGPEGQQQRVHGAPSSWTAEAEAEAEAEAVGQSMQYDRQQEQQQQQGQEPTASSMAPEASHAAATLLESILSQLRPVPASAAEAGPGVSNAKLPHPISLLQSSAGSSSLTALLAGVLGDGPALLQPLQARHASAQGTLSTSPSPRTGHWDSTFQPLLTGRLTNASASASSSPRAASARPTAVPLPAHPSSSLAPNNNIQPPHPTRSTAAVPPGAATAAVTAALGGAAAPRNLAPRPPSLKQAPAALSRPHALSPLQLGAVLPPSSRRHSSSPPRTSAGGARQGAAGPWAAGGTSMAGTLTSTGTGSGSWASGTLTSSQQLGLQQPPPLVAEDSFGPAGRRKRYLAPAPPLAASQEQQAQPQTFTSTLTLTGLAPVQRQPAPAPASHGEHAWGQSHHNYPLDQQQQSQNLGSSVDQQQQQLQQQVQSFSFQVISQWQGPGGAGSTSTGTDPVLAPGSPRAFAPVPAATLPPWATTSTAATRSAVKPLLGHEHQRAAAAAAARAGPGGQRAAALNSTIPNSNATATMATAGATGTAVHIQLPPSPGQPRQQGGFVQLQGQPAHQQVLVPAGSDSPAQLRLSASFEFAPGMSRALMYDTQSQDVGSGDRHAQGQGQGQGHSQSFVHAPGQAHAQAQPRPYFLTNQLSSPAAAWNHQAGGGGAGAGGTLGLGAGAGRGLSSLLLQEELGLSPLELLPPVPGGTQAEGALGLSNRLLQREAAASAIADDISALVGGPGPHEASPARPRQLEFGLGGPAAVGAGAGRAAAAAAGPKNGKQLQEEEEEVDSPTAGLVKIAPPWAPPGKPAAGAAGGAMQGPGAWGVGSSATSQAVVPQGGLATAAGGAGSGVVVAVPGAVQGPWPRTYTVRSTIALPPQHLQAQPHLQLDPHHNTGPAHGYGHQHQQEAVGLAGYGRYEGHEGQHSTHGEQYKGSPTSSGGSPGAAGMQLQGRAALLQFLLNKAVTLRASRVLRAGLLAWRAVAQARALDRLLKASVRRLWAERLLRRSLRAWQEQAAADAAARGGPRLRPPAAAAARQTVNGQAGRGAAGRPTTAAGVAAAAGGSQAYPGSPSFGSPGTSNNSTARLGQGSGVGIGAGAGDPLARVAARLQGPYASTPTSGSPESAVTAGSAAAVTAAAVTGAARAPAQRMGPSHSSGSTGTAGSSQYHQHLPGVVVPALVTAPHTSAFNDLHAMLARMEAMLQATEQQQQLPHAAAPTTYTAAGAPAMQLPQQQQRPGAQNGAQQGEEQQGPLSPLSLEVARMHARIAQLLQAGVKKGSQQQQGQQGGSSPGSIGTVSRPGAAAVSHAARPSAGQEGSPGQRASSSPAGKAHGSGGAPLLAAHLDLVKARIAQLEQQVGTVVAARAQAFTAAASAATGKPLAADAGGSAAWGQGQRVPAGRGLAPGPVHKAGMQQGHKGVQQVAGQAAALAAAAAAAAAVGATSPRAAAAEAAAAAALGGGRRGHNHMQVAARNALAHQTVRVPKDISAAFLGGLSSSEPSLADAGSEQVPRGPAAGRTAPGSGGEACSSGGSSSSTAAFSPLRGAASVAAVGGGGVCRGAAASAAATGGMQRGPGVGMSKGKVAPRQGQEDGLELVAASPGLEEMRIHKELQALEAALQRIKAGAAGGTGAAATGKGGRQG